MLTPEIIKDYIKKTYPDKIFNRPSFLLDDPNSVYIPLELLPEIYYQLLGKEKKPAKKKVTGAPLYFKEFIDTYNEFYLALAWNTRKLKPTINDNASEKSALWSIMRQIQALATENMQGQEYSPDIAVSVFKAVLKSAQQHKFIKDKISLHLINKYFNELVASAMKRSNIYTETPDFNNFDHINKPKT